MRGSVVQQSWLNKCLEAMQQLPRPWPDLSVPAAAAVELQRFQERRGRQLPSLERAAFQVRGQLQRPQLLLEVVQLGEWQRAASSGETARV